MHLSYILRPEDRAVPAAHAKTSSSGWLPLIAAGLAALLGVRALVLGLAPPLAILAGLLGLAVVVLLKLKRPSLERQLAKVEPGSRRVELTPSPGGGQLQESASRGERTISIKEIQSIITTGRDDESRTLVLFKDRIPMVLVAATVEDGDYDTLVRALYEAHFATRA